jgi:hypothetical protein
LPKPPRVVDLDAVDHNTLDADAGYARALAEFVR